MEVLVNRMDSCTRFTNDYFSEDIYCNENYQKLGAPNTIALLGIMIKKMCCSYSAKLNLHKRQRCLSWLKYRSVNITL